MNSFLGYSLEKKQTRRSFDDDDNEDEVDENFNSFLGRLAYQLIHYGDDTVHNTRQYQQHIVEDEHKVFMSILLFLFIYDNFIIGI